MTTPNLVKLHSVEAEQSVLSSVMMDNNLLADVAQVINPSMFYDPTNQAIANAIWQLQAEDKPFDPLTVSELMQADDQIAEYLCELIETIATAIMAEQYAEIIAEKYQRRQMINIAEQLRMTALQKDNSSAADLLDKAESLLNPNKNQAAVVQIKSIAKEYIETLQHRHNHQGELLGLSTGLADLDKRFGGLREGGLTIVAGRPGMGKTVLGNGIACHCAYADKKKVLMFSLEMPSTEMFERQIASLGSINNINLRSGKLQDDDWNKLASAVGRTKNTHLYMSDITSLTIQRLRTEARRLAKKLNGVDLIVLDYMQLMEIPGDDVVRGMGAISRGLKTLALELKCHIIALSQLNRGVEQRANKRPLLSDLRESGAIEQDADIVLMCYRDEYYNDDTEYKGIAEIITRKFRQGEQGTDHVVFQPQYSRFKNVSPDLLPKPAPQKNYHYPGAGT